MKNTLLKHRLTAICLVVALALPVVCQLTACGGKGSDPKDTTESRPTGTETTSDTQGPGGEKTYPDIGDGHFVPDETDYYVVVGQTIRMTGHYDFDAAVTDGTLTITCPTPNAIEAEKDGSVKALAAGDHIVEIKEENYGTTTQVRLHAVGSLTDNIIISVPVWRGKWVNEQQFRYMKDADVDMVVAVSGVETADYAVSDKMLTTALSMWRDGRGLFVLAHSTKTMLDNILTASDDKLQSMVNRFKGNPAFAGYHLIDEPYDCAPYAAVQNKLGQYDPHALTDVNFLPGGSYGSLSEYENRLKDYGSLLDGNSNAYISFDNYPFPAGEGAVNEYQLFGCMEAVRRAGLFSGERTAYYVQAVGGFNNSYRRPDEATLTYHFATGLAYGFKWIKYWSWFVPDYGTDPDKTYADYTDAIIDKQGNPSDLYAVASDLNKRTHTLGSVLVQCEAAEVYHTGNLSTSGVYTVLPDTFFVQPSASTYSIVTLFVNGTTGEQYLMAVNKDLKNRQTLKYTLDGVTSVTEINSRTGVGVQVPLTDGKLSVTLDPGDFAFFALPAGDHRTQRTDANLAADAIVKASVSASRNGFYTACVNDGLRTSEADAGSKGWRVEAGKTGTLTFTLAQETMINRVDLYPTGAGVGYAGTFPTSISVYVAAESDPENWTQVYAIQDLTRPTEVPVIRFDAVRAKYVRLVVHKSKLACELAEVEIYSDDGRIPLPEKSSYEELIQEHGVNYALGKTPIASGSGYESTVDKWGLAYLTDGYKLTTGADGTNGWWSQGSRKTSPDDSVWGGVDLGAVYTINKVLLYPRKSGEYFPTAYTLQVSIDGENWTTLLDVKNDTETSGVVRTLDIGKDVQARYVRVVGHAFSGPFVDHAKGYIMQFSEIEVYWD